MHDRDISYLRGSDLWPYRAGRESGSLTPHEKRVVNRLQNRTSRRIYRAKPN